MKKLISLAFLTLTGFCLACSHSAPEAVARDFMESYYSKADLQRSQDLSAGMAKDKIAQQVTLGGGQANAENQAQRRVSYTPQGPVQLSSLQGEDRAEMVFTLSIDLGQQAPIKRAVKLSLQKSDARWKVVNFIEV